MQIGDILSQVNQMTKNEDKSFWSKVVVLITLWGITELNGGVASYIGSLNVSKTFRSSVTQGSI